MDMGPDEDRLAEHIGKQSDCDWCGKCFVLARRNMLCDSFGDWQLNRCDDCTEKDHAWQADDLVKKDVPVSFDGGEEPF